MTAQTQNHLIRLMRLVQAQGGPNIHERARITRIATQELDVERDTIEDLFDRVDQLPEGDLEDDLTALNSEVSNQPYTPPTDWSTRVKFLRQAVHVIYADKQIAENEVVELHDYASFLGFDRKLVTDLLIQLTAAGTRVNEQFRGIITPLKLPEVLTNEVVSDSMIAILTAITGYVEYAQEYGSELLYSSEPIQAMSGMRFWGLRGKLGSPNRTHKFFVGLAITYPLKRFDITISCNEIQVPQGRENKVARMITRINHSFPVGGAFKLAHKERLVYFHWILPLSAFQPTANSLEELIADATEYVDRWVPAILAASFTDVAETDILDRFEQLDYRLAERDPIRYPNTFRRDATDLGLVKFTSN